MRVILFRHGENVGDELTAQGHRTVKNVGKQLREFNIKKIFTSSAKRCQQTTEILSKILNLKNIVVKDELKERFQLHRLPGNKAEQRWWDNYMNLSYVEPKNDRVGETLQEFVARNNKIFNEILKTSNKDEDVLIVAHSATSYALTSFIYNTNEIKWMKLGNANYIMFEI